MSRDSAMHRLAAATGLAVLALGCSSNKPNPIGPGGPGLSNPTATTATIHKITAVDSTPGFKSFLMLSPRFIPTSAPVPLGQVTGLIRASLVREPGSARPQAPIERQTLAARALLQSDWIKATIIGPAYLGHTYTLSSATGAYAYDASRTGAPTNGVRFILYALDATGNVATPLAEQGRVDFIDLSTATTNALRVQVVWGATTYADYTISGTYASSSSASLLLKGFVSDGSTEVHFDISYTANQNTVTGKSTIDAASLNLHLVDNVTVTTSTAGTTTTLTYADDFSLTVGTETVAASGTITDTLDSSTGASSSSGTLTVQYNGQAFAKITFTKDSVTITDANGGTLAADQQAAVLEMYLTGAVIEVSIILLASPFYVV